jgi:argininosuccinate lyase
VSAGRIGRLSRGPNPVLFELLYEPHFREDRAHLLGHLLSIDAAHVIMLGRCRLIGEETARRLCALHRHIAERLRAGDELFRPEGAHRGLYLVYEQHFIAELGPEVGGASHFARSRNDINAALTRMRLRDEVGALVGRGAELLRALVAQAGAHVETFMSSFTHQQPAQPSSFGHYLAGVAFELERSLALLARSRAAVNVSPMGAGAAGGTAVGIDPAMVARLLGFEGSAANSLDAVASRDFVVHVLSPVAVVGSTLSRLATDMQTWASHAYGFLDWPDDLVSTSSMMPQKRNAYVWENVRGHAADAAGGLVGALMALKGGPFANSVEVSWEATSHLWPALESCHRALTLTTLLIANLRARPEAMRAFLEGADTVMTALADHLVVRHGLAFRTAHQIVSELASARASGAAPGAGEGLAGATCELLAAIAARVAGRPIALDPAELSGALDPVACARAARYGGGPAPESVRGQLASLAERAQALEAQAEGWRRGLDAARAELEGALAELGGRGS